MKLRSGDSKIWQIVKKGKIEKIPAHSFVLMGVPDDRGVAISKGGVGAKGGPDAIREELFKMTLGVKGELADKILWDAGNLKIERTQEKTYQKLKEVVAYLLSKDCLPIILGGGHDLSFGSLSGFLKVFPHGGIVNIDTHLDARPPEAKGRYSSGSAFWQLLEKTKMPGKNLIEFGYQTHCNSKTHFEYLRNKGVHLVGFPGNLEANLSYFTPTKEALAVSFDMDCVQASDAPGVSAPATNGYTAREALHLVSIIARIKKLKLFEVMEVNPRFDADDRTAKLAARLIWELIALIRER